MALACSTTEDGTTLGHARVAGQPFAVAASARREVGIVGKGPADNFERHFERNREKEALHKARLPGEDDDPLPPPVEPIKKGSAEPGRNDPCPCGSGKKYKQCCLKKKD